MDPPLVCLSSPHRSSAAVALRWSAGRSAIASHAYRCLGVATEAKAEEGKEAEQSSSRRRSLAGGRVLVPPLLSSPLLSSPLRSWSCCCCRCVPLPRALPPSPLAFAAAAPPAFILSTQSASGQAQHTREAPTEGWKQGAQQPEEGRRRQHCGRRNCDSSGIRSSHSLSSTLESSSHKRRVADCLCVLMSSLLVCGHRPAAPVRSSSCPARLPLRRSSELSRSTRLPHPSHRAKFSHFS